jgi:hypothetical protein
MLPLPLFPTAGHIVRLIEGQIKKISLPETVAIAMYLGIEYAFVGNGDISQVSIFRKNEDFAKGDSWFNVQWCDSGSRAGTTFRSINLRFEPGRQVCTSYW